MNVSKFLTSQIAVLFMLLKVPIYNLVFNFLFLDIMN